jgi:hypothetical protein
MPLCGKAAGRGWVIIQQQDFHFSVPFAGFLL